MASKLLKGREVADQLSISLNTLYRLADAGEIRSIRVGKQRRFRAEDVEAYLDGSPTPPLSLTVADGAA